MLVSYSCLYYRFLAPHAGGMRHGVRSLRTKLVLLAVSLSLLCAAALSAAPVGASPTETLTRAVKAGGSPSIATADPESFTRAFTAVAARVRPREVPAYVSAAVKLRPDLADKIVVAAITLVNSGGKNVVDKTVILWLRPTVRGVFDEADSCERISAIVKAAISAYKPAAVAIIKAAISVEPMMRDCIVTAAIAADPDQEYAIRQAAGEAIALTSNNNGNGFYQALNPASYQGAGNVVSPEQPPAGP
jgi:hypothetical protein